MNRLKTFNQFINESLTDHQTDRYLDLVPKMTEKLRAALAEFQKMHDHMISREAYWFNRESREIRQDHYAIDVKTYEMPSVDEWREAIGEPDAPEDQLYDAWSNWLTYEIEDFEENVFLEKYSDVFSKIAMGGRSGGWMCLIPSLSPTIMMEDIEGYVNDVTDTLAEMDQSEIEDLNTYFNTTEEERARLIEYGLINEPEYLDRLSREIDIALSEAKEDTEKLNRQEEACKFVIRKHAEFRQTAEESFLAYEKERYD